MKFRFAYQMLSTVMAMFVSGCFQGGDGSGLNDLENDEATAEKALTDPFKALGTGNEDSYFGDQELADLESEEVEYSDAVEGLTSSLISLEGENTSQESSCDTYFMRLRWGQFRERNDDVEDSTDWSGAISVNAGKLIIFRTLGFDRNDSISERTDPKVINFISKTRPHFDGLRLKYVVCPSDLSTLSQGEEVTFTFNAPNLPFAKSYTTSDLAHMNDLVKDIDANSNKFQLQSVLKSNLCQGTMEGRWHTQENGLGVFKGKVDSSDGIKLGHIKGVFAKDSQENNVFAAKFISRKGRFKGLVVGTYGGTYGEENFEGTIYNRKRGKVGNIEGTYVDGDADHKGTFSGIYTLDCADDAADTQDE